MCKKNKLLDIEEAMKLLKCNKKKLFNYILNFKLIPYGYFEDKGHFFPIYPFDVINAIYANEDIKGARFLDLEIDHLNFDFPLKFHYDPKTQTRYFYYRADSLPPGNYPPLKEIEILSHYYTDATYDENYNENRNSFPLDKLYFDQRELMNIKKSKEDCEYIEVEIAGGTWFLNWKGKTYHISNKKTQEVLMILNENFDKYLKAQEINLKMTSKSKQLTISKLFRQRQNEQLLKKIFKIKENSYKLVAKIKFIKSEQEYGNES